jgi:hypothetical protein
MVYKAQWMEFKMALGRLSLDGLSLGGIVRDLLSNTKTWKLLRQNLSVSKRLKKIASTFEEFAFDSSL